ncbi:MAG: sugar transferase [Acidobacteriota bacterium]
MQARSTVYCRFGKRLFDIIASLSALIVLSPVLCVVGLLVRIFLGAPVIFRQTRGGRNQTPFTIFKFRSMLPANDPSGNLRSESARITSLGRILRATSLDELPGLFNVLRGDMSLVGPRPLLTRYGPWYAADELSRFDVLPGITGWAQINGRNALGWDDRFQYDVYYAQHVCLSLDLKILFLTVGKVLRRDDVHVDSTLIVPALDDERRQKWGSLAVRPQVAAEGKIDLLAK